LPRGSNPGSIQPETLIGRTPIVVFKTIWFIGDVRENSSVFVPSIEPIVFTFVSLSFISLL
jgi:hypothetical protein